MSELNILDIILPTELETGPLALGWWLIIAFVVFALATASYVGKRYYSKRKAQRLALKQWEQLKQYGATASELNHLLKQAALAYFPREQIAALSGEGWFIFLDKQLQTQVTQSNSFMAQRERWERGLFAEHATVDAEMLAMTQYWLRHAIPPRQQPTGAADDV